MKASHILVKTIDGAKYVKDKIAAGEPFSKAAKMYSQCTSAVNGGDLGEFVSGQMVKPFEEAVLALEVGQTSDPVETQFGWHIIQRTG